MYFNKRQAGSAIHVMLAILLVAGVILYGPAQGQPSAKAVSQQEKYVKVAAAETFAAGLTDLGQVYVWGQEAWSGEGSRYGGIKPSKVHLPEGEKVADIDAGFDTLYFLMEDGKVMALGANDRGQAGNGSDDDVMIPDYVYEASGQPLADVKQIAAGYSHVLALKENNTVWVWGGDQEAILGVPGEEVLTYAHQVRTGTGNLANIERIAAGYDFSLAVSCDGEFFTWGNDQFGQLANGSNNAPINVATLVPDHSADKVFAGSFAQHAFYTVSGAVYGWGQNDKRQVIPDGSDSYQDPVNLDLSDITAGVKEIRAGYDHTLILANDGTVWGMGNSSDGQLTDKQDGEANKARQLNSELLKNIVSIEAGYKTSYAVNDQGEIWVFGLNDNYQLGTDEDNTVTQPVKVDQPGNYTVSLSGKVLHVETGLPLEGVPLRISHVYGWKTAVTDSEGSYQFELLPDDDTKYTLETDMPDYRYVNAVSILLDQSLTHDLEVDDRWINVLFVDADDRQGYLGGYFYWEMASGLPFDPEYHLYFESDNGEQSDYIVVSESYRMPNFLYINNVEIPDDAAYIRLYVAADRETDGCPNGVCPLPLRVPIMDSPDRVAVIDYDSITGSDSMIQMTFEPAPNEEGIIGYEVLYAELRDKDAKLHSLGKFEAGRDIYHVELDPTGVDFSNGISPFRVRALLEGEYIFDPEPEPEPGDDPFRILRFFDDNDTLGEVSGNLIFRVPNGASEQNTYEITVHDKNGHYLYKIGSVSHGLANDDGVIEYFIPSGSVRQDAARIGIRLEGDEKILAMVAVWDNPGLQFLDVNPNTGQVHGELRWERHPDDEMIVNFGVQVFDSLSTWNENLVGEVIIEPSIKRGAVTKGISLSQQSPSYIALVGLDRHENPVAWAVVQIQDTNEDSWHSDDFKSKFRGYWRTDDNDRFTVTDVIRFRFDAGYDFSGDGIFDETELEWLLQLIEPLNPLSSN